MADTYHGSIIGYRSPLVAFDANEDPVANERRFRAEVEEAFGLADEAIRILSQKVRLLEARVEALENAP